MNTPDLTLRPALRTFLSIRIRMQPFLAAPEGYAERLILPASTLARFPCSTYTTKKPLRMNTLNEIVTVEYGDGPLVAAALHDGHDVRPEVEALLRLTPEERRREEDPFTRTWTSVAPTRIVGLRSRFEVDLNRPRDKAVYLSPEDAWGLEVWKRTPLPGIVEESIKLYDRFYDGIRAMLKDKVRRYGRFVVYDIHSYNHLRDGPGKDAADPNDNPEVNVGTGTMRREQWAAVVDRFIQDLSEFEIDGRRLDVRENIRFKGGEFPKWIHQTFPHTGCAIAIEFKKTFMNEWTGEPDLAHIRRIEKALAATVPGVIEELGRL